MWAAAWTGTSKGVDGVSDPSLGRLGHREATVLTVILLSSKIFLTFPRTMLVEGTSAGWMIVIISALVAGGVWFGVSAVLARFPGESGPMIAIRVLGPGLGHLVGISHAVFFLGLAAIVLRQFGSSFIIAILPTTPLSVIIGGLSAVLVAYSVWGAETIGRTALFAGPVLAVMLILLLSLNLSLYDTSQILPIFGMGLGDIAVHGLTNTGYFAELATLAVLVSFLRNPRSVRRIGYAALVASALIKAAIVIFITMVFPFPDGSRLAFPLLELSRGIDIGEFFERVEALFVFLWQFTAVIALSALLFTASQAWSHTFKVRDYRPLLGPLAVIVIVLAFIPESTVQAVYIDHKLRQSAAPLLGGLGWLTWLVAVIRGMKGDMNVETEEERH